MIEKRFLQKTEKGNIYNYFLDNGKGLKAEILNLGGIVRRLIFDGVDVVLGREDYQKYTCDPCYFGAIIGRNSNRMENTRDFALKRKCFQILQSIRIFPMVI